MRRAGGHEFPVWPLYCVFLGAPFWWVLGMSYFIWPLVALPMLIIMVHRGNIRVPPLFWLWLLFLAWMLASATEVDSGKRLMGFALRAAEYFAATIFLVYVYNLSARRMPVERLALLVSGYWAFVVAGGFLGVLHPHGTLPTPMSLVVPRSLQNNSLVANIVRPPFSQVASYGSFATRPSAPFIYTNQWGNNYSVTLPFVFIALAGMRRRGLLFWALAALVPLSLVPAFLTLNRGMFLALGVGLVYVAVRLAMRGQRRPLAAVAVVAVLVGAVALIGGVGSRLQSRLSSTNQNSTQTRSAVYQQSFDETLQSPLLGYGAPRPASGLDNPALGTQGQFWTVMFSTGFPGLLLFVGWFLWLLVGTARAPTTRMLLLHTVALMTLIELVFYDLLPAGMALTFVAAAVVLRGEDRVPVVATTPAARRAGRLPRLLGPRPALPAIRAITARPAVAGPPLPPGRPGPRPFG